MTQVVVIAVMETDNVAGLRRRLTERCLEPPVIRVLSDAAVPRDKPKPGIELNAVAFRVFEYWRQTCGHQRAVPGDRIAKVKSRLREGFTEDQLRQAIDGAAKAATVNEVTKKVYDDLELICRNASKVEDFIDRSNAAGVADQSATLARRFG